MLTTALYPLFVRSPELRATPEPPLPTRDRQLIEYSELLLCLIERHGAPDLMDRFERVLPRLREVQGRVPARPEVSEPVRVRLCGRCRQPGHNAATCTSRKRRLRYT